MKKRLAVANGTYQNSVGETKTRWVNVGVIGIAANGKDYMLIDPTINFAAFPREQGKDMVMVGMFEDEQNAGQQQQPQQGYQQPQHQTPVQVYKNAAGQLTDPQGNLLLDANGQPRYQ
ncbi:hypothetical protein [Sulfurimonas sp.]|uniref:hypothetical protein n=1 Tax=Sulfurimonas sp. TaxID=2022749 RepID=UPI0035613B3D